MNSAGNKRNKKLEQVSDFLSSQQVKTTSAARRRERERELGSHNQGGHAADVEEDRQRWADGFVQLQQAQEHSGWGFPHSKVATYKF